MDQAPRRPGERLFLWCLLAFSAFVLVTAARIPNLEHLSSSGVFPIFTGSILVLACLRILWSRRERYAALTLRQEISQARSFALPRVILGYALVVLVYILTTSTLGFLASSYLFLVVSFVFLKGAGAFRSAIVAAGMLAAIYLVFHTVFKVILW